jgi:hypothetical protein
MLTRNTFLHLSLFLHNYRYVLLAILLITVLAITFIMPGMVIRAEGVSGPSSCPGC